MDIKNFKGAIFDLDGTLIESNYVWSKIDAQFLGKRGIAVPADYFKKVSVMNFEAAADYTNRTFGLGESISDIIQEWFDMAIYEYSNVIRLVGSADKFLCRLKENGVKIALATASSAALYEPVLKHNGIYGYFDFFASTEQVKRGKGFPDVYEFACENLGLTPADCIVFEDIIEGIRGAKLGGFFSAACLNEHYKADWDKLREEADISFHTYDELMQFPQDSQSAY